ncbi:MAG: hypothetical protein MJ214_03415 [Bacilli bacterium]|nr:hypothetical protein [Bacilli bacterium]
MSKRRFPLNKFPELLKNPPPDVDIMLYDKKKEGFNPGGVMKNSNDGKMTLTKLAKIVSDGFKQVNTRIDNLEARIDQIDARLDYNGLKKLPNNK